MTTRRRIDLRRFPDVVTIFRATPPMRNEYGEPLPPGGNNYRVRASIQPVEYSDTLFVAGRLVTLRLKVVIPDGQEGIGGPALRVSDEDRPADKVTVDGHRYQTESIEYWRGSHEVAIVEREVGT